MKKCPKCKSQILDDVKFCPYCGANVEYVPAETKYDTFEKGKSQSTKRGYDTYVNVSGAQQSFDTYVKTDSQKMVVDHNPQYQNQKPVETNSSVWGVLGFFLPLIGFILYLTWRTERPKDALNARNGALFSTILIIFLVAIMSCTLFNMSDF